MTERVHRSDAETREFAVAKIEEAKQALVSARTAMTERGIITPAQERMLDDLDHYLRSVRSSVQGR